MINEGKPLTPKQETESIESSNNSRFLAHFMRHGKPLVSSGEYGTDRMPFHEFASAIDVERSKDIPLSEEGVLEVLESMGSLSDTDLANIKIIFSSSFLRATQTAETIAKHIKSKLGNEPIIHTVDLLKEVELDTDSLTEDAYNQMMSERGIAGILDFYTNKWINGLQHTENIDDSYQRAERFLTYLRRVRKWTAHDQVFVCTHGWIARIIKHIAEGGTVEGFVDETRMLKTAELFSFGEDDLLSLEPTQNAK